MRQLEREYFHAVAITADQVKNAVKCAGQEEDRTKNIIMFGVTDNEKEEKYSRILNIYESLDEKPTMTECVRRGSKREGVVRPIKVTLGSLETVHRVLSEAGQLQKSQQHRGIYLSVDRTQEERQACKKLVEQLKQKREAKPEHYHFIRNKETILFLVEVRRVYLTQSPTGIPAGI